MREQEGAKHRRVIAKAAGAVISHRTQANARLKAEESFAIDYGPAYWVVIIKARSVAAPWDDKQTEKCRSYSRDKVVSDKSDIYKVRDARCGQDALAPVVRSS